MKKAKNPPAKSKGRTNRQRTASQGRRSVANAKSDAIAGGFPRGVARPALRALASAGYFDLHALTFARKADVLELHGMGPKALGLIESAMQQRGLKFLP